MVFRNAQLADPIANGTWQMSTNNLLEPGNHALLLIDHQYLQLLTLRSHEASQVISNATSVAKVAKIFKVPKHGSTLKNQRRDGRITVAPVPVSFAT
jgi:hypothetical protein